MKHDRACSSLARFLACYLFTCVAVYLYFRYYLLDERDYGTPPPAAVIHDSLFRPLDASSSSKVAVSLSNELFKKLQSKNKARNRPGFLERLNGFAWHKSEDGFVTRSENPLEKSYKFQPSSVNAKKVRPDFNFAKYSNASDQNEDLDKIQIRAQMAGNSTRNQTNTSSFTLKPNKLDLKLEQVIPKLKNEKNSSISNQFHDFRREWLRQRRARVDWQSIIQPCIENMAWGQVKDGWGKLNRSSATTSDVISRDIRPAGQFSKIFIQSKTSDNRTKVIGGDTWRVYVRGPSSVAATVFDHNNGTYEALFLITEPGVYHLMIYLDYSLCDGFRDPPRDWFIKGNAQGKFQKEGLLGALDDYLMHPFKNGEPIKINVTQTHTNISLIDKLNSCAYSCNQLWDGFGRWTNDKWRPHLDELYNPSLPSNYSASGTLWVYGDSLGVRLFGSLNSRASLCKKLYVNCKNSYNWLYPITNEQLNREQNDDLDFRPGKVLDALRSVLNRPEMQQKDSVLLLNLGLHYPVSVNFTTYQKVIADVINMLKETEINSQGKRVPKYKVKIIWKSTTAICKHKGRNPHKTDARFLTTQRVLLFSAFAMSAMCQAGYDVIDVYPMTESYPGGTLDMDDVHYPNKVFVTMETLLEKYKANNNQRLGTDERKRRIRRCSS
ncbi:hypothetical protein ACROYT_G041837 [Oculina patagonica]